MWGSRPLPAQDGTLDVVLITGFPAGMLACNCYVLAKRAGADAIIVDPGQRAMAQLRRILDDNHLTASYSASMAPLIEGDVLAALGF